MSHFRRRYLTALSAEIAKPGKGILDAYLLPFVGENQERQAWGGMIGGLPGLEGHGVGDAVAGNYEDAEVSEQYREFELRRGYRIEPAADDDSESE
eukprot:gene5175-biopygen4546